MSHDDGRVCACRVTHAPHPLELERHHVYPLGMGGDDSESNVVWVCPTTHTNTHELLRLMVRALRVLSWGELLDAYDVPVSRYAYELAVDGFNRWQVSARNASQVS